MRFNSRVARLALLLAAGPARAQDESNSDQPSDAPAVVEEMIVLSDMEIARKRQAVINNLRSLGYREHRRKDGRSMFRPHSPWKPSVLMDDDAYIVLRRTPVRIDPPGNKDNKLRYLWCLPPFTVTAACIRVGGQLVSGRKLAHAKEDVVRATTFEIRQWRSALVSKAMEKRVNVEVPDLLADLWERGQPDGEDGIQLWEASERRQAILQLWASRSCTPEGAQVRQVVMDFLRFEVQASPTPATTAEIDSANAQNRCGDILKLDTSPTLDAPIDSE